MQRIVPHVSIDSQKKTAVEAPLTCVSSKCPDGIPPHAERVHCNTSIIIRSGPEEQACQNGWPSFQRRETEIKEKRVLAQQCHGIDRITLYCLGFGDKRPIWVRAPESNTGIKVDRRSTIQRQLPHACANRLVVDMTRDAALVKRQELCSSAAGFK